jgi:glycolate oxidase FAD binding subunit
MSAEVVAPESPAALAGLLREAGEKRRTVELGGAFSKRAAGGEVRAGDLTISTRGLNRLLKYEPADLTISVEAGMPYRELEQLLASNGQVLPLDPPFADTATVGGVAAAATSGPRRRRYGTVRDMLIGMEFVTLEGKAVQSGGMVVKNVTGLDMAKLMVGSFGTLAAIASLNFKVFPRPHASATFIFSAASPSAVVSLRRKVLAGQAEPIAIDIVNEQAVRLLGRPSDAPWKLLCEGAGSPAVVSRYRREYEALALEAGVNFAVLEDGAAETAWSGVRRFPEAMLQAHPGGAILRVSATASGLTAVLASLPGDACVVCRAGAAVCQIGFMELQTAAACASRLRTAGLRTLVEYAPPDQKAGLDMWIDESPAFSVMQRLKLEFDPHNLLNPGRLYNRI